ncbi:hypothetical protein TNCV_4315611 [Trichonephila clavipes]|nr:hypothetical protein TNCV_4315611 [Trichonephila clavipes]
MDSLGHSSYPPSALCRQDDEEATRWVRPLQLDCLRHITTLPWPSRSQISHQSRISGIIWDGKLESLRVLSN